MRARSSGPIDLQARVSALEQKFPTEENRILNLFMDETDAYYIALVRGSDTGPALAQLKESVSAEDAETLVYLCHQFHEDDLRKETKKKRLFGHDKT